MQNLFTIEDRIVADMLSFIVTVRGRPLPFTATQMEEALRDAMVKLYPEPRVEDDIEIELEKFEGDLTS
jgi:hypothetical protein